MQQPQLLLLLHTLTACAAPSCLSFLYIKSSSIINSIIISIDYNYSTASTASAIATFANSNCSSINSIISKYQDVAAIFYAVYSTLCICVPTWTPGVHLWVQSSECYVPLASATELVRGTHSLRILRWERAACTDDMKYYARMTSIRTLAYCKLRTRPYHDNIHWFTISMFAHAMWYALVCKWMCVCIM